MGLLFRLRPIFGFRHWQRPKLFQSARYLCQRLGRNARHGWRLTLLALLARNRRDAFCGIANDLADQLATVW